MKKKCSCCKKIKNIEDFYLVHCSDDVCDECKDCMQKKCYPFKKESVIETLQKLNYPYVENKWIDLATSSLISAIGRDNFHEVCLGRYISLMKLKQYKNYNFSDSFTILNQTYEDTFASFEQFKNI